MQFWFINQDTNKPEKITIDPSLRSPVSSHLRWSPEKSFWISKNLLFETLEDAIRIHVSKLKNRLSEVDGDIANLTKQQPESLSSLAQAEIKAANDANFIKTKVPHLWIVK